MILVILFLTGGPPKVTRDVSRYEETMRKYTSEVVGTVHTGFFTFPNPIPDSAFENGAEPTFYFSYQDTWDDPTCEVYLKCTYSDEDYASELNRLKNDKYTLKDEERENITQLEYEESGRFIRPVYKAIDADDYSYEYAMDLGENEIAYIYTSFKTIPLSLRKIPKEYLPSDYAKTMKDNMDNPIGFNVYSVVKTNLYRSFDYGDKFGVRED